MKEFLIGIAMAVSVSLIAAASASGQTAKSFRIAQLKNTDAQAIEKLDMAAVPDLDRGTVRKVQVALRHKGFDPGPANGVMRQKTKMAVKEFQDKFGIKETGELNNQTLFALGVVAIKPAAVEKEKEEASRPEPKKEHNKSRRESKSSERKNSEQSGSRRGRALWCAEYNGGGRNCGFYTFEQCRAAISGIGGSCSQ
jgi:peptidoglycan hydrolase-like protein with peptidoglycan-binding domain